MNGKISVFVICVEAMIYLLLHNFHDYTFNDNIRMERLFRVIDSDPSKSVEVIGTSGIFYETALKCLKSDYGNPLVIAHLRFKVLFDRRKLKVFDRSGLRQFYQQLKTNNTWFLSIGYKSPLLSCENLTKFVSLLPPVLRKNFYKSTDSSAFKDGMLT